MTRRSSSLNTSVAIARQIGTQYESVKVVADNLDSVLYLASIDLEQLANQMTEATDFEGISVVAGDEAGWNPDTKTITVPTLQGEKGDKGLDLTIIDITYLGEGRFRISFSDGTTYETPSLQGKKGDKGDKGDSGESVVFTGIKTTSDYRFIWSFSDGTVYTTPPLRGQEGRKGDTGKKGDTGADLTIENIENNQDGTMTVWFSDGTVHKTQDLRGRKGDTGSQGRKGDTGISVHHLKPTSTTDPHGKFGVLGEIDTYTFYGDVKELINLGHFRVHNGISTQEDADLIGIMSRKMYDRNNDGIVDNSEKFDGLTSAEWEDRIKELIHDQGTIFVTPTVETFNTLVEDGLLSTGDMVLIQEVDKLGWQLLIIESVEPDLELVEVSNQRHVELIDYTTELDTVAVTFPTAINELVGTIGNLEDLTGVATSTTVVGAVNAVYDHFTTLIGNVADLSTNSKEIVGAISELYDSSAALEERVTQAEGDIVELQDTKYDKTGGTITGNVSINQNLAVLEDVTIAGDLTVAGSMNTVDAVTLQVEDNTIILNKGEVGHGVTAGKAGIVVDRGLEKDYNIMFSEATGTFQIGKDGSMQDVATRQSADAMIGNRVTVWDSASKSLKTGLTDNTEYSTSQAEDLASSAARVWTPRRIVNTIAKWWSGSAEKAKLDGIATGATKNDTDTNLKNRANHTGTQAISTVAGLQNALDGKEAAFDKNTAFNKNFGTAAGTVTQGNDSRLSNSREWTAETISQAEAEAGTATTRRAFTAQRVKQAFTSFFNSLTTVFTRSLLTKADAEGFRDELGFGANAIGTIDKNASTSNFLRGDGTWVTPPNTNTTYSASTGLTLTGTAFSVNYGSAAGTAAQGNDSRLSKATVTSDGIMSKEDKSKLDLLGDQSLFFDPEVAWFTYDRATDTYLDISQVKATSTHKGMRRCLVLDDGTINYFLDPNNSALKEDGTPSVLTGADGQVMVSIPRFYCARTVKGTVETWIMSAYPRRGLQLHPAFVVNGSETDILYGAYPAVVQASDGSLTDGLNLDNNTTRITMGTDKLASLKGSYAMVGLTRSDFRTLAGNRGASWTLIDWLSWQAVAFLLYTEYGNLNSQTVTGRGNVSRSYSNPSSTQTDSPHTITGVSDASGNNTASAGEPNPFMSYRGIEHFYGNNWQFVDGINVQDFNVYITTDPDRFSDDYTTMERLAGSLPIPSASESYVNKLQTLAVPVMLPESVGGNSGQYIGDAMWSASGARVVIVGGPADGGLLAGVSCFSATYAASYRYRNIGSRIMRRTQIPLPLE